MDLNSQVVSQTHTSCILVLLANITNPEREHKGFSALLNLPTSWSSLLAMCWIIHRTLNYLCSELQKKEGSITTMTSLKTTGSSWLPSPQYYIQMQAPTSPMEPPICSITTVSTLISINKIHHLMSFKTQKKQEETAALTPEYVYKSSGLRQGPFLLGRVKIWLDRFYFSMTDLGQASCV